MDEIRKYGAMDILISDSAKLEISERVNDILRTMVIQKWQSEPYEYRWQLVRSILVR